jgi:hypothetical protein
VLVVQVEQKVEVVAQKVEEEVVVQKMQLNIITTL